MDLSNKKVSYFADFGAKNRTGGGYTFAQEFYRILKKLPIQLTTFAVTGVKDINLPQSAISYAFRLRRKFGAMPKQDLYLFDQPQALLWALPKAPSIAMFHGTALSETIPFGHPKALLNFLFWRKPVLCSIEKGFLSKKLGIPIFNSFSTLKAILQHFQPADLLDDHVTYLPLDLQSLSQYANEREARRKALGIDPSETLVLCLSNFSPVKQAEFLPSLAAAIFNQLPKSNVRFLFIGRGIDSKPLDDFVNSPLSGGRCIRIGEISREEALGYQHAADIAISTSKAESFGYSLTESMGAKLPLVAFNGGAIPEIIEHEKTGFISSNQDEFCGYLKELILRVELRKTMGEAGLKRVERMFSSSAFETRFLKILKNHFTPN